MVSTHEPEFLGAIEAAELLGISRRAVLKRIETGKLPAQRIGAQTYLIRRSDVQAAIKAGPLKPGPLPGTPRKRKPEAGTAGTEQVLA